MSRSTRTTRPLQRIVVLMLLGILTTAAAAAAAQPQLQLEPVVDGLDSPLFLTHAGDGSGRLFVVERAGRVLIVERGALLPEPFLDIQSRVLSGRERGLLGLAFHPGFDRNGRFFVYYTREGDGASVVAEYQASDDPDRAQTSERVLLTVPQPFANHNGGMIAFGRKENLFIGLGDGGSAGDPGDRAQDPDELLGKILRIGVGGEPYTIPPNNPFANGGGRPEIFALGLRNPWRFSFDRANGRLLAGDVGQGESEEIDRILRGRNYGWRLMEGTRCYRPPEDCEQAGLEPPIAEYQHEHGRCSVTGGYVYRGRAIPALRRTYLFGDYCSGEIFGLDLHRPQILLDTDLALASFGEDEAGELYVLDIAGGAVYRIADAAP